MVHFSVARFATIIVLGILTGAEVDLFIPSFPELQDIFHLTPFEVELTLGVNLAAHCLTALVVGNLGDRYGRRPIILLGLTIFTLGSFLCVFAPAFWVILLGRLLQGIGIAGPAVLGYLVLADHYPADKQQHLMGILNGVITLAMAFAPVVGSYVSLYFHWQGNFILLLGLGVVSLVLTGLFIPVGSKNPDLSIALKEYLPVLRSSRVWWYGATICALVLGYWVFIGMAPILYMEDLGVSLKDFGFYQGSMAGVFSVASLSSAYFLKRFGQRACFFTSLWILGAFLIGTALLLLTQTKSPLLITLVMQLLALGIIFPVNILWPLSLYALPEAKGRVTALIVSSRFIFTALGIQIVSALYNGTFLTIGLAVGGISAGALFCCLKLNQRENLFSHKAPSALTA